MPGRAFERGGFAESARNGKSEADTSSVHACREGAMGKGGGRGAEGKGWVGVGRGWGLVKALKQKAFAWPTSKQIISFGGF